MNETTDTSARIISPQRRKLIHFGMIAGAMGAVSVVAGNQTVLARQTRNPKADIELINGAIALEQRAVNTYQAVAKNNLLPTKAYLDVALQFASDHTHHRDLLKKAVIQEFKAKPADVSKVGTFPIPQKVLHGGEAEVLRYALTIEMLASKAYFNYIREQLTTKEAVNIAANIMPIENQHVAVYRTVLIVLLKDKGLPGDTQLVPYPFLSEQPTPPAPVA